MELGLRYVTRFLYSTPVWESHNALRACPAHGDGQQLLAYQVDIEPEASVYSYEDEWGTRVDTFGILDAHTELVVIARAQVDTRERHTPENAPIEAVSETAYRDGLWAFLQPTRHTQWGYKLAGVSRQVVSEHQDVVGAVSAVDGRLRDTMEYKPGATEIGVDVESVWATGVGVCQDFAHLMIAMLRSVGVAARYVSGYFYAADPAHPETSQNDEIVVATHAWVEVAVPGSGWWAIDPTNTAAVGERHVKIGHGRDYDDVTPLRGVYYGESEHQLVAEVTMSTGYVERTALPDLPTVDQQ